MNIQIGAIIDIMYANINSEYHRQFEVSKGSSRKTIEMARYKVKILSRITTNTIICRYVYFRRLDDHKKITLKGKITSAMNEISSNGRILAIDDITASGTIITTAIRLIERIILFGSLTK